MIKTRLDEQVNLADISHSRTCTKFEQNNL